jgi:hypothetical protein
MNNVAPMKILAFCLLAAVLGAAPVRVARVGELEGKVEVQLHAADLWRPAVRNLPVVESTWVRTAAAARVEMELDDGSILRLVGDALCEFSDYTRLSTGQRVTVLSLDHGIAYFTGEPYRSDAVILAVPGAQATVRSGTRMRLEARDDASQIAVLEGSVRFSSPVAELDLGEGQTARVENASRARFFLCRETTPLDSDRWNEQRDKVLASSGSGRQVPGLPYGLVDLDSAGEWVQTNDLGAVWKPKVSAGWVPYRDGQWLWYDELGYMWIANEPWGWLPFHYGRWIEPSGIGWVWAPGKSAVFKPGDVYWLKEAALVGWGPLAPGETWDARAVPRLYLRANTTRAKWMPDAREFVPAEIAEPIKAAQAVFVVAPPSPAFDAARLEATRPVLRAGSTRIVPILPGVTYAPNELAKEMPPVPSVPPEPEQPPEPASPPDATIPPNVGPPPGYPVPIPEPVEIFYPAPVYTGIVVVNPPEKPQKSGQPASSKPGLGMPRGENQGHRETTPVHSPEPAPHPTVHAAQPAAPAPVPAPANGSGGPKSNDDSGSSHSNGKHGQ